MLAVPHVIYNIQTEKQTNAEHNTSLLYAEVVSAGLQAADASLRPYILLPSFLFIAQM